MPTLTPTKLAGSTAKASDVVYVEPDRTVTDADLEAQLQVDGGMNAAFLADLLSACLTHERCGVHLYRSVAGRTNNPVLKRQYERFGKQTLRHVEILERVVEAAGGNPTYVSPMARAVEGADSKVLEATYATSGSLDPMAEEMAMLDAVFMAETIDHANWESLGQLAQALPEGPVRTALEEAVAEVEPEEDEHHGWAKETRAKLTMLQAQSRRGTKAMSKAEELMAQVKGWLRGGSSRSGNGNGSGSGGAKASTGKKRDVARATAAKKPAGATKSSGKTASRSAPSTKRSTAAKKSAGSRAGSSTKRAGSSTKKATATKSATKRATGKKSSSSTRRPAARRR